MKVFWEVLLIHIGWLCWCVRSRIIIWNYPNLLISSEIITLSWTKPSDCGDMFNSILVRQLPGGGSNRTNLGNLTYFEISRDSENFNTSSFFIEMEEGSVICAVSETSLQFPTEETSVKTIAYQGEACISPSNTNLGVIWPKSNNESDGICECGIWTQIAKCSCDNNYFDVYNKEENFTKLVCWRNLVNKTVITITTDHVKNSSSIGDSVPVVNRRVMESYFMIIPEKPESPNINVIDATHQRYCFTVIYDGNSQNVLYHIKFVGLSGYRQNYTITKQNTSTCETFPNVIRHCSPYILTAQSENVVGRSNVTTVYLPVEENRNVCKCFRDNVKLQINYHNISNATAVLISISCQSQDIDESEISLEVKLNDNTGNTVKRTITKCSKEFLFKSLHYYTTYEIEIFWKFDNVTLCRVENDANTFNTGIDPNANNELCISLPSILLGLLIILTIIIVISCYILRHKKTKVIVKMEPEQVEH